METDEDLLQRLAAGGAIDYSVWPRLLCTVVSRLETIAHNDFPIPNVPPPRPLQLSALSPVRPSSSAAANGARPAVAAAPASDGASSSPDANKENTTPSQTAEALGNGRAGTPATTAVAAAAAASSVAAVSSPLGSSHTEAEGPLPVQIADLLNNIITTLTTTFARYPPHTIQRLSELVLAPRRHYRNLTSYLHAVERVTNVTSGSNSYPLPPAIPDMSAMSLLANGTLPSVSASAVVAATANGVASAADSANASLNVGSDEALGGALLTPIPWLRPRPTSSGDEHTDGSSPPSSSDSGDVLIGDGDGSSGSGGGLVLNTLAAQPTPALQQQLQPQQPQQPQQSPAHRIEGHVRTESTETIDGPNGVGSIETVSVSVNGIPSHGAMTAAVQLQQQRGITQGELLRQEQKAGVVPVSQLARAAAAAAAVSGVSGSSGGGGSFGGHFRGRADEGEEDDDDDDDETSQTAAEADSIAAADCTNAAAQTQTAEDGDDEDDEDEVPHARGPDEIGAADTGPQPERGGADPHAIDLEAAVGRKAVPLPGGAAAIPGRHAAAASKAAEADADGADTEAPTAGGPEVSAIQLRVARASTPKREADEALSSSIPTKRLKEGEAGKRDPKAEPGAANSAQGPPGDKAEEASLAAEEQTAAASTTAMEVDQKTPAGRGGAAAPGVLGSSELVSRAGP